MLCGAKEKPSQILIILALGSWTWQAQRGGLISKRDTATFPGEFKD